MKKKFNEISSMKPLLTILFLWVFVCHGQVGRGDSVHSLPFKEFYRATAKQFATIDSLRQSGAFDSLETENEKIIAILTKYKSDLLYFPDSSDYGLIYLAKSEDRNLVLVSWDTRMGGTMIDFTTMVVYKTTQGIKTEMLIDSSNLYEPHSYMHYNSIHTLTVANGNKIYLGWGNGQGSTAIPWQEIRAFSIIKDKLVQPKVFPGGEAKIFVDFDLHYFKENELVPVIKVEDRGRRILVPIPGVNQGFSGKYQVYRFNGKIFSSK